MAVSDSYDFSVACSEIIAGALRSLNLIATGESPSTQEQTDGREALNMLIKAWQSEVWFMDIIPGTDTTFRKKLNG